MGLWEDIRERIIEDQGDISNVPGIPNYLKEIYRTAFTTNPHAYIEVAARAQKWVDQALSRNMYLESRDMDEMKSVYMSAWKKGLKTTYYLHMKPRHTAEQSTTNVDKSQMTGKRGFGAIKLAAVSSSPASIPELATMTAPVVPVSIETTPFIPASMPVSNPLGFATSPLNTPSPVEITPSTITTQVPETVVVRASLEEIEGTRETSNSTMTRGSITTFPTETFTEANHENSPASIQKRAPATCPIDPQERLLCDSCQ